MQDSGINEIDKQTSAGFHKCHGVIVESLHTSKTLVFNLHGVAATIEKSATEVSHVSFVDDLMTRDEQIYPNHPLMNLAFVERSLSAMSILLSTIFRSVDLLSNRQKVITLIYLP